LGFVEGSGNTHPGQGTANRRFFFDNFMLELLWVSNRTEAKSEKTSGVRLADRCERRSPQVCPYGIIFRPASEDAVAPPFPTWRYTPDYLPEGLAMLVAQGTTLYEPELIYLPFLNRGRARSNEPLLHAPPIRRICALSIGVTRFAQLSSASRAAQDSRLLNYFDSPQPVMEIMFEGSAGMLFDLRPNLPLIFRSISV
jgi:hypothetical protein